MKSLFFVGIVLLLFRLKKRQAILLLFYTIMSLYHVRFKVWNQFDSMWRHHNWRSGVDIEEYSLLPEYGPGEDIIDL